MGMGLLAVPVLLQIDPVFVPGPILCGSFVLTCLMIARERGAVDLLGLKWGIVGRLAGTAAASAVLAQISSDETSVIAAGLILVAVALSLSGVRVQPTRGILIGAGAISGVMSTLASVGGPPIALLYQHERGPRLRATMSGYLLVGTVVSVIGLALAGRFGVQELQATAIVVPAVLLGYALSGRLIALLDRGYVRTAVLLLSAASSIVLLARHFL
jgi:uncharacterized membrane protein YfcA